MIFTCNVQRLRPPRSRRLSAKSTGNPIPPSTTATIMGRQIHGSVANLTMLLLKSANPALLNAETAWNTPRYSAREGGSS